MPDYRNTDDDRSIGWSDDDDATVPTIKIGEDDTEDTLPGIGVDVYGEDEADTLPGIGGEEEPFLLLSEMQIVPDRGGCPCAGSCGRAVCLRK